MKEIFKTIKQHFILLFGTGLFTYGLFSFDSGYYYKGVGFAVRTYPVATYYYYNDTSLILLTIGAILIIMGLLKMRKKNLLKNV